MISLNLSGYQKKINNLTLILSFQERRFVFLHPTEGWEKVAGSRMRECFYTAPPIITTTSLRIKSL
jgi:hypothetical protein